jgi:hypothetical protein
VLLLRARFEQLLASLGFSLALPTMHGTLPDWWSSAVATLSRADSKKANFFIMLTPRTLWLERNARVFDGVHRLFNDVLGALLEE